MKPSQACQLKLNLQMSCELKFVHKKAKQALERDEYLCYLNLIMF